MTARKSIGTAGTVAVVLALAAHPCAQAQPAEPVVSATMKPASARVGDPVELGLRVTVPDLSRLTVKDPEKGDGKSTWTVRAKRQPVDSKLADGKWQRDFVYTLSPFATGDLPAPPIEIAYQHPDGRRTTRTVEAGLVRVASLLPADKKLEELSPKSIKGITEMPLPWWLTWGLGAVGALLVAGLAFLIWKALHRRLREVVRPVQRLDEWALSQLAAIEEEHLPEKRRVKDHYTRTSDTVRAYLGRLFHFNCLDLTTWETLEELRQESGASPVLAEVESLLSESDLVKFARHEPDLIASRRAVERARSVVQATRHLILAPGATAEPSPADPVRVAEGAR